MKKITFLVISTIIAMSASSQVVFEEYFSSFDFPPEGWTAVDFDYKHWHESYNTNLAGGESPELMFDWYPYSDKGEARFISPKIDFSGENAITLKFKHTALHDSEFYKIGVLTSTNGEDWTKVWSDSLIAKIDPEEITIPITNGDVNSATFQFAFYFDGDCNNTHGWYIDDVIIEIPYSSDIKALSIISKRQFKSGDSFGAISNIQNIGTENKDFKVKCNIYSSEIANALYTDQLDIQLNAGEQKKLTFKDFTLPENGQVYKIEVISQLEDDQNKNNDTIYKYINTYTNAKQKVLLEIGTATWCGSCPSAAIGADELKEKGYEVAIIEHHSNDDYSHDASRERVNYLGISGFPTAIFDGINVKNSSCASGNCFEAYKPIFESSKAINTPISISISGENYDTNKYNVIVTINKFEPVVEKNLKLRLALTETHIYHPWGASPPLEYLDFVNRAFYPNAEGYTIDLINNDKIKQEYSITIDDGFEISNCEIVAFVESDNDKYVYQTESIMLSEISVLSAQIFPSKNSTNAKTDVRIEVNFNKSVTDVSGTTITDPSSYIILKQDNESGTDIPFTATINDNSTKITIDPNTELDESTFYYVELKEKSVKDNKDTQNDKVSSRFKTGTKLGILLSNYQSFKCYPNPVKDKLNINFNLSSQASVSVQLFDILGRNVINKPSIIMENGQHTLNINTNELKDGIYIVVLLQDGQTSTQKINIVK